MRERAEAMVLASFAADSHALGTHLLTDIDEIHARFGRIDRLLPGAAGSAQEGRPRGSFTTYGNQSLALLRHLSAEGHFAPAPFANTWRDTVTGLDGFQDPATAQTLRRMNGESTSTGHGSSCEDLAAAARIAPLVYLYRDDLTALNDFAIAQTGITHANAPAEQGASFFARVAWNSLNGKTPSTALLSVAESTGTDSQRALVQRGMASTNLTTADAAREFGQGSTVDEALPMTVHLIAKHEGSLEHALVENVSAGGDTAVRGMIVGMVLAAFHGRESIPDGWASELLAFREIDALLEDLEAAHQRSEMAGAS